MFERLKKAWNRFFGGGSSEKRQTTPRRATVTPVKARSSANYVTNAFRQGFQQAQRGGNGFDRQERQTAPAWTAPTVKKPEYKSAVSSVSQNQGVRRLQSVKIEPPRKINIQNREWNATAETGTANVPKPTREWIKERQQKVRDIGLGDVQPKTFAERRAERKADTERYMKYMGWENLSDAELARRRKNLSGEDLKRDVEYWQKYHPTSYHTGKQLLSGATLGTTDMLFNVLADDERKAREEEFEKNLTPVQKGLGIGANVLGSMATFGMTAAPMEEMVGNGFRKLAPGLSEKGAAKLAQWSVTNPRIAAFLRAVGTDASINLTTGAYADLMHALADSNTPDEFVHNMGRNAMWNWAMGLPFSIASGVRGGRHALSQAVGDNAEALAQNRAAREFIAENADDAFKNLDGLRTIRNNDDIQNASRPLRDLPELSTGITPRRPLPEGAEGLIRRSNVDDALRPQTAEEIVDNVRVRPEADAVEVSARPASETIENGASQEARAAAEQTDTFVDPNPKREKMRQQLLKRREQALKKLEYMDAHPERYTGADILSVEEGLERTERELAGIESLARREAGLEPLTETRVTPPEASTRPASETIENSASQEARTVTEQATELERARMARDSIQERLDDIRVRLQRAMEANDSIESNRIFQEEYMMENSRLKEVNNLIEKLEGADASSAVQKTAAENIGEATEQTAPKAAKESAAQEVETAEQKAAREAYEAEQAELAKRAQLDNKVAEDVEAFDIKLKRETGGELSANRGVKTVERFADPEEAKKMAKELSDNLEMLDTGEVENLNDLYFHKVKGKAYRDKISRDSIARLAEPDGAKNMIKEMEGKIAGNKMITLEDVSDAIALRSISRDADGVLDPEIADLTKRLIVKQKTQSGQGMVVTKLLMNSDQDFRADAIRDDMENFIKKVCGVKDADIDEFLKGLKFGDDDYEQFLKKLSVFEGSEREWREKLVEAQMAIYRQTEPSVMEMLNMWRHTALLGKGSTVLNNIFGNLAQYGMGGLAKKYNWINESLAIKRFGEDQIERTVARRLTGDNKLLARTYTGGWVGSHNTKNVERLIDSAADKEYARMYLDWKAEDIDNIMKTGNKHVGRLGKGLDVDYTGREGKGLLVRIGNKLSKWTTFLLEEPDTWFVEANYNRALSNYLEANGIKNSADALANPDVIVKARRFASAEAMENTYKEANSIAEFISKQRRAGYKSGASIGRKSISIGLDAILPYDKVPMNVARQQLRYSPVGATHNCIKAYSALRAGDAKAFQEAMHGLSKGEAGLTLMTIGWLLRCRDKSAKDTSGFVATADEAVRDYGMRNYSLMVNGYNFNLANMGQGATQFLIGAALGEECQKLGATGDEDPFEVMNVLNSFIGPTFEMSIMENFSDFLGSLTEGDTVIERLGNAAAQAGTNYIGQYLPTSVRAIGRGTTSADLDTGIPAGGSKIQRTLLKNRNQLISGVPILNEKVLPHKVSAHDELYHERKTAGQKAWKSFQNLNDPFQTQKVNIPDEYREDIRLGVQPKKYDQKRKYEEKVGAKSNGYDTSETFKLTGKERERAALARAQSGKDSMKSLVKKGFFGDSQGARAKKILSECPENEREALRYLQKTPEYASMSDDEKRECLNAFYSGRDRTAKHEVYVNIKGNDESHFELITDYSPKYASIYEEENLGKIMSEDEYMDTLDDMTRHTWDEETRKNKDEIAKTKGEVVTSILKHVDDPDDRIKVYDALKHKNWKAWDGVSEVKSGGKKSGTKGTGYRRYGGYRRRSGGGSGRSSKVTPPSIKTSAFKAQKQTYKSAVSAVRDGNSVAAAGTKVKLGSVKITPPAPRKG